MLTSPDPTVVYDSFEGEIRGLLDAVRDVHLTGNAKRTTVESRRRGVHPSLSSYSSSDYTSIYVSSKSFGCNKVGHIYVCTSGRIEWTKGNDIYIMSGFLRTVVGKKFSRLFSFLNCLWKELV